MHLCDNLCDWKNAEVYIYFKGFVYESTGSIAYKVAKGGAVVNEVGNARVDAAAFREANVEHV